MRKLLHLTTLILFFGCDQNATTERQANMLKESKFKNLLTKYREISFDTLQVFSSDELENSQYKFKGTQLDSADILLLPKKLTEEYINDNGYFACYKFSIDSIKTGLITRSPSTYESSSVKLLLFDAHNDSITDYFELAETFGDAGDYASKTSWLFKNERKQYKNLMWYEVGHDNSVDDEKDTTVQTWNYYYLFDISKEKADTISKNEKELTRKFGKLLNRQASH